MRVGAVVVSAAVLCSGCLSPPKATVSGDGGMTGDGGGAGDGDGGDGSVPLFGQCQDQEMFDYYNGAIGDLDGDGTNDVVLVGQDGASSAGVIELRLSGSSEGPLRLCASFPGLYPRGAAIIAASGEASSPALFVLAFNGVGQRFEFLFQVQDGAVTTLDSAADQDTTRYFDPTAPVAFRSLALGDGYVFAHSQLVGTMGAEVSSVFSGDLSDLAWYEVHDSKGGFARVQALALVDQDGIPALLGTTADGDVFWVEVKKAAGPATAVRITAGDAAVFVDLASNDDDSCPDLLVVKDAAVHWYDVHCTLSSGLEVTVDTDALPYTQLAGDAGASPVVLAAAAQLDGASGSGFNDAVFVHHAAGDVALSAHHDLHRDDVGGIECGTEGQVEACPEDQPVLFMVSGDVTVSAIAGDLTSDQADDLLLLGRSGSLACINRDQGDWGQCLVP